MSDETPTISRMTGARRNYRIGLYAGVIAIAVTLILQFILLRQLSVFNSPVGLLLLLGNSLEQAAVLVFIAVVGSFAASRFQRRTGSKRGWIVYFALLGLVSFGAFAGTVGWGLDSDVRYSTFLTKARTDYLNLSYLSGAVIWTTLLLTAALMLSEPRFSFAKGTDGKRHLYMHSKLLGLLRLFAKSNLAEAFRSRRDGYYSPAPGQKLEWDIGDTLDHAVVSKDGKTRWNDRFRASSPEFVLWTTIKLLIGLAAGGLLAPGIALRFLTIQNYLTETNSSWAAQLQNYFAILYMRLSGTYLVPPSFGIDNTFTFEVFRFFQTLLGLVFVLVGLRLGISALANLTVGASKLAMGMSRKGIGDILVILTLPVIYAVLNAGTYVYDVGTPLTIWPLLVLLAGLVSLTALTRTRRILQMKRITPIRGLIIIGIVLVSVIAMPAYGAFLRGQSGRYIEYQWTPAYVPTIEYTRWQYAVDSVTSADLSMITAPVNQTEVLRDIRIFTQEAAGLNMKPLVGVNWMSIDNAPVDIIFVDGTEYWVSILQLVRPPVTNDIDAWRSERLLLTHSEKILAVNAATTETIDMSTVWNLTETPQIYYGEGGLWESVQEVYLNIPTFNETHLTNYNGPPAYNGEPDYVYSGFWRYWKFFWQGRLDFASGNYGDIKALAYRDVGTRLSSIMLPGMTREIDPYPVVDDAGNIYLLDWFWIDWRSPHDFADYPDHVDTSILRLFAATLTNLKTGEITGYLFDTQRTDYVLNFYRSMYPQWNQQMPAWLVPQLRYPEHFFEAQQEVYNFYFQTDPLQWQRNVFLQSAEDTRFIIIPINGNLTWAAVRLVEIYQSPSKNLAGLYIAPAGSDTGKVFLIRFPEGTTVLGPDSAISAVRTDPRIESELTLHPEWKSGNILLYSVGGRLLYVIPYYGIAQQSLNVPVMVAVVDGATKAVGFYRIQNPSDFAEVNSATGQAVSNIGVPTGGQTTITGTLTQKLPIVKEGYSGWLLNITQSNSDGVYTATIKLLSAEDMLKIDALSVPGPISVVVDSSKNVIKVN